MTVLIISNKKLKDIMKIFKSLKESDYLIQGISATVENESKKVDFLACYWVHQLPK